MKLRIPMSPGELPQQRLYFVEDLPRRPVGFKTTCNYGVIAPPGIEFLSRKPSRARLLCQLEWAWSPANNRISAYYLSMNRSRSRWLLWMCTPNDDNWDGRGRWECLLMGIAPRRGVSAFTAAVWLLHDSLEMEMSDGNTAYLQFWINEDDLLSVDDIQAIRRALTPQSLLEIGRT